VVPSLAGEDAGFVSRLVAFLIDWALLALAIVVTSVLWSALVSAGPIEWLLGLISSVSRRAALGISATIRVFIPATLSFGIVVGYFLFFFVFSGQTIGKRLIGLKVVPVKGGTVSLSRAIVRLAGYLLSTLPLYSGFLAVLFSERRRAWHDRLSGTRVIYAWEAHPDERFLVKTIRALQKRNLPP
jgi:uncharacterized RDD family membrane protein YckC